MLKIMPDDTDVSTLLNTRVRPHIRILNGSLDESISSSAGIVLNGRIDPSTMRFLKVDNEYQRPLGERPDIFDALKGGLIVPNIEIGVRGQDFETEGSDILIYSPAYIIDGWQRVGNALRLLELIPHQDIRIFGSVHFGTDQIWERHRFTALNKNVKKVSPNLHLRNMRDTNDAILTLFGLSNNDKNFPLYKKICWSQNMQRSQLLSALTFSKIAVFLHGHVAAQRVNSAEGVSDTLARAIPRITLPRFRKNLTTYFTLFNDVWPFSAIEYREKAVQLKSSFLFEVARMLSRHPDFWTDDDRILAINADDRRKLGKFPIDDPQIVNLAGSTGKARTMLYQLLVNHMNSGRRTNRLRSRLDAA